MCFGGQKDSAWTWRYTEDYPSGTQIKSAAVT